MFNKNVFTQKDSIADLIKPMLESQTQQKLEELKGNQPSIDKNKNNKIDAGDFKILRGEKKEKEEVKESSPFDWRKPRDSESKGGSGVKQGRAYGGGAQKSKPEHDDKDDKDDKKKVNEGRVGDALKAAGKKAKTVARAGLKALTGGSDEDQLKRLQKNMGAKPEQQTGKRSMAKYNEEFNLEDIDPALVEEFMQTEEFEQLDELSKNTLKNYVHKSVDRMRDSAFYGGKALQRGDVKSSDYHARKEKKRLQGTYKATERLAKEEVESLDEGKKLIGTHGDGPHTAKVYKNSETGEHEVHFFKNGKHMGEGPVYYTDDKEDAHDTAKGQTKRMNATKNEEVEQIDELKKSTIKSYIKKKSDEMYKTSAPPSMSYVKKTMTNLQRAHDRNTGVKPTSEEVEQVDERTLTASEKAERERVVKGMKKGAAGFKARYGNRAKSVMYATATKVAKKD